MEADKPIISNISCCPHNRPRLTTNPRLRGNEEQFGGATRESHRHGLRFKRSREKLYEADLHGFPHACRLVPVSVLQRQQQIENAAAGPQTFCPSSVFFLVRRYRFRMRFRRLAMRSRRRGVSHFRMLIDFRVMTSVMLSGCVGVMSGCCCIVFGRSQTCLLSHRYSPVDGPYRSMGCFPTRWRTTQLRSTAVRLTPLRSTGELSGANQYLNKAGMRILCRSLQ